MSKRKPAEEEILNEVATQVEEEDSAPKKPVESKSVRFIRLAERRTNAALKIMGHIANLGNRNQYEYTEEQANAILTALQAAHSAIKAKFQGVKSSAGGFTLSRPAGASANGATS